MASAYLKTKCNRCGSPTVKYSADRRSLKCSTCKYVEPLPQNKDMISEKALGKDFDFESVETGLGAKFNGYICLNCAAFVAVVHTHNWTSCPFCGNEEAESFRGK